MNILVTGHSSGIGEMLTKRLEAQGHTVFGLSRSAGYKCDVSNWEDVDGWARYLLDADVYLDGIVTCAGTQGELGKLTETDPQKWTDTIRINLEGTYNTIRAFYPLMDQTKRKKIVCLAGGGSGNGRAFFSAYAVAKTGVVRMVETIALEDSTLDINAVAPGAIKTKIIDGPLLAGPSVIGQEEYEKALKQNSSGDDPEPALSLIEWLLSNESDGISGKFISARWDNWSDFKDLSKEIYTLRRITK